MVVADGCDAFVVVLPEVAIRVISIFIPLAKFDRCGTISIVKITRYTGAVGGGCLRHHLRQ